MNSLTSNRRIFVCFTVFALLLLYCPAEVYGVTWTVAGNPSAVITKTHLSDSVQFTIVIGYTPNTCPTPRYGVGIIFATSLANPTFQVYYQEWQTPNEWYYQEWTGTGWKGWGGPSVQLGTKPGFSAVGSATGNTFTITVPFSALGGCGGYYFAIQFRTPTPCTGTMNSLPQQPNGNIWDLPVSSYLYQDLPPCPLVVTIDIRPGSDPNSINLNDQGLLPVAILGSATLDISTIDETTLQLGGVGITTRGKAAKTAFSIEDVNGDGYLDLVSFFKIQDLVAAGALDANTTKLLLTGLLRDATPITGSDFVRVVPP